MVSSKERLTLHPAMGSSASGSNSCTGGIEKIEFTNIGDPEQSQYEWAWQPRDVNKYLFPPDQSDSENRKGLPLISVWELNSRYQYTGRMLVEVARHEQDDAFHQKGELVHGHIIVRRPIRKEIEYQIGDDQTIVVKYDAWQCLDINSHRWKHPTTAYSESLSYEGCFSQGDEQLPITSISAGAMHTCATRTDGTAWCWGYDGNGQLGNGTAFFHSWIPAQVMFQTFPEPGVWEVRPFDLAQTISAGGRHTCALQTGGTAWCWGANDYGQLGNGDPLHIQRQAPVSVQNPNSQEPAPMSFRAISAGSNHTCAITPYFDGGDLGDLGDRLYCWGENAFGQLGDSTFTDRDMPTEVLIGEPVKSVSAGSKHTCAIAFDGAAYCWGHNASGQLGDGLTANRYSATRVPGLVNEHTVAVTAGSDHSCAFTCSSWDGGSCLGSVWCWGENNSGQVGDGSQDRRLEPVAVMNLPHVFSLDAGNAHNCAIGSDQTVYCWGSNATAQIGDNTQTDRLLPTEVLWP